MKHEFLAQTFNAINHTPHIRDLLKLKLDLFRDNGIEVTGKASVHKILVHLKARF